MSSDNAAILFLTSWYPVAENPVHGIFIRNHAIALSGCQNVVTVYAYSSNSGPFYKIEETKVNENFTELRMKYPKPGFSLPGIKALSQALKYKKAYRLLLEELIKRKTNVKAIQVNIVFPVSIVLNIFKDHYKVKHTIAENWSGYLASDGNYKGAVMKYFTKNCFAGSDKIWHVSQLQKEALQHHGLVGNFELLYNTVNTDIFKPVFQKAESNGRVKLLHVSSLVEREKNITGTFRVMKKLEAEGKKFDLTVIGGSEETISEAKKMAMELQLNAVTFLGGMSPEKIAEHMQQSNALILFSNYEGMPVVALEALSCGLPVLATRVGQLPHLISDKFGCLVDLANEAQMLEALENLFLFKYKFNPQAMRDFILQHASYEAVGKQFNEYYSRL